MSLMKYPGKNGRSHIIPTNASEDVIREILGKAPGESREAYYQRIYPSGTVLPLDYGGELTVLWWIDQDVARVRMETPALGTRMVLMGWDVIRIYDREYLNREKRQAEAAAQKFGYAWGELTASLREAAENITRGFRAAFDTHTDEIGTADTYNPRK